DSALERGGALIQQRTFFCSAVTSSRTVSGAFGNSVLSSPKVEQAASFWPRGGKGHAELEQCLRRLVASFVFLVALEEGVGGSLVLAAAVEALADPILGIRRERILGVALYQLAEGHFGARVIVLRQGAVAFLV